MGGIKWTEQEDRVLINCVIDCKIHCYNLNTAFKEASNKLNRTIFACSSRWFKYLGNPESSLYVGLSFSSYITSEKESISYEPNNPIKLNLWKKFITYLKSIIRGSK